MNTAEARLLGSQIKSKVEEGAMVEAYDMLAPILAQRTPFAMLRHIGSPLAGCPIEHVNAFMQRICRDKSEGGWVVIASVLHGQTEDDIEEAFRRCRGYIITADIWYATDIFGEGVIGQALLHHYPEALNLLGAWRKDENEWVRRTLGTAFHFWAKRTHGAVQYAGRVLELLEFLEPMFEEKNMNAVKGVGWGLKTTGRYYPEELTNWLRQQLVCKNRLPSSTMLRKALTFLSQEQRARAVGM